MAHRGYVCDETTDLTYFWTPRVTEAVRKLLVLRFEDALSFYSDFYKEVHGFRPRGYCPAFEAVETNPRAALAEVEARIQWLRTEERD